MSQQLSDALQDEAHRLEVELNPQVATALLRYFETLSRWAQRIRVSGATDPLVLVRRHFADSLALSRVIPTTSQLRCVDVGSGGGLPGLPTALLRADLRITLVEVNARKCAMLRTAIHDLGLSCEVLDQRVETLPLEDGEPFDVAWSLATFAPPQWLERGVQLVGSGGRVVAFTARQPALAYPGLDLAETLTYTLHDGTPRVIRVYQRKGVRLLFPAQAH